MSEQLMFLPESARHAVKRRGHAWLPGSGPEGETCRSCKHYTRIHYAGTYLKCKLMEAHWTHGPGSDIRAKDPACKFWERRTSPAFELHAP